MLSRRFSRSDFNCQTEEVLPEMAQTGGCVAQSLVTGLPE
jgi:hypothetical protein